MIRYWLIKWRIVGTVSPGVLYVMVGAIVVHSIPRGVQPVYFLVVDQNAEAHANK